MFVLSRALTVQELNRKVEAAKILVGEEGFSIAPVGNFITDSGELVFFRYANDAEVKVGGRKYVEIRVGAEGVVKAHPVADGDPRMKNEFIIYKI